MSLGVPVHKIASPFGNEIPAYNLASNCRQSARRQERKEMPYIPSRGAKAACLRAGPKPTARVSIMVLAKAGNVGITDFRAKALPITDK